VLLESQRVEGCSQYLDVMTMGRSSAISQEMLDFIYTYYGDKPFSVGEFRTPTPMPRSSATRPVLRKQISQPSPAVGKAITTPLHNTRT
jgi:hypothetical protein